jgi:hypothetical protein
MHGQLASATRAFSRCEKRRKPDEESLDKKKTLVEIADVTGRMA